MTELVIFDCDGVLVDSEVPSNQVMADNLARYGLRLTLAECMAHFVGGTMQSVAQKARDLGADLPGDWIVKIDSEIHARLKQGVDLVPGIPQVLEALDQAGLACCVASNGEPAKMEITLGQNGLWERFRPVTFSARVLGVAKPEPDLFLAAAAHFGADPKACVVIEDSTSGAQAARAAGMRCLGYAPLTDGAGLRAKGAEVFHDMADLPGLIGI